MEVCETFGFGSFGHFLFFRTRISDPEEVVHRICGEIEESKEKGEEGKDGNCEDS